MKHVKRVIAVIVALAVAVGFMPAAPVKAETTSYGVWVNGSQFDSDHLTITCGTGTAEYDPDNNKLTLTNAVIYLRSMIFEDETSYNFALIGIEKTVPKLDIVLVGDNIIEDDDDGGINPKGYGHGIYANHDCDISISGEGNLKIKDVYFGISTGTFEKHSSKLSIDTTSLEITSINDYGIGIRVMGGVSVKSSNLTITSKSSGVLQYSDEYFDAKDSTITIKSGGSCLLIGDSVLPDGGVRFDNCIVSLESYTSYGIDISKYYEGYYDEDHNYHEKDPVHTRKLIVKNGGSLEIKSGEKKNDDGTVKYYPPTNFTDSSGTTDTTKIIVPSDSTFSNESGYGSDWSDNKIKIKVGTKPVDEGSGSTPTPTPSPSAEPTPGGDASPAPSATPTPGNGDGNGNGDGSNSNVPRDQQKGEDGTELGKGAAAEQVDKFLTAYDSEADAPGTLFRILQAKSTKTTKNSITVTWKKAPGAVKYLVYASKCGKGNKPIKMDETTKTKYTLKKLNGKKISKGTYYKFIIVAVDSNNNVVSSSKTIHSATLGGKVGNCKSISTKAKKNKVSLKAKKTFKLKPKQKAQKKKLKIKNHRKLMYESSDETVATVNKSGVIKAVGKGNCEVFVYAQNGVFQKIKVTVK